MQRYYIVLIRRHNEDETDLAEGNQHVRGERHIRILQSLEVALGEGVHLSIIRIDGQLVEASFIGLGGQQPLHSASDDCRIDVEVVLPLLERRTLERAQGEGRQPDTWTPVPTENREATVV